MRIAIRTALIAMSLVSFGTVSAVDVHVGGYGGYKTGDSALAPVDKTYEYGLVGHVRPPFLPVGVSANWFQGRKDGDALTASGVVNSSFRANELQLGIGRVFDPLIIVHPFIAGGATRATATLSSTNALGATISDNSGQAWGYWGHAGAYASLGLFEVGALVGYSRADVELGTEKLNVGGTRMGVVIGLGF